MAARFGDMLLERRRMLGLSIQQVANTIKIRPQIIEFFEMGDFSSMPPRGYAQGMISSYARFLGLNPRDVVNAYFDDLMAYERETSQSGGRFQEPAAYVNARSSTDSGRFLMVSGGRTSRYTQRPQQAGYVTETGSRAEIQEQRDRFRNTLPPENSALPAPHGNVRDPRAGYGDGGYSARNSSSARSGSARTYRAASTRTGSPSRNGYRQEPVSHSGGRSSTQRYVSAQRGNRQGPSTVRGGRDVSRTSRYPRQDTRRSTASQPRNASRSGLPNGLDPRFVYGGLAVIAALLIILIVVALRGCGSSNQAADSQPAVTTTSTKKKTSKNTDSSASSDDDDDDEASASTTTSKKKNDVDAVTKVKVKVAKGKTAWIEIKVDGKSVYGAQATGPFEQEYEPESSIEITTSKPSDVTVTKNGEKVRYDTKTSGVARVTITVPKKSTESSDDSDNNTDEASDSDSTDIQSADGTDTSDTSASDDTTTDSSSDGSTYDTSSSSAASTQTTYDSSSTYSN